MNHKLEKLSDLKPAPYNPRRIEKQSLIALERSLEEFGDISGLVWNRRTGHLVCGHQRLEALREKHSAALRLKDGMLCAPSGASYPIRIVDWPATKEKAANVAANSQLLAGEFTESLPLIIKDIQVGLSGNVVDIDTYGEPWEHWIAACNSPWPQAEILIFLTHGQGLGSLGSISFLALESVGIPVNWQDVIPPASETLREIIISSCLTRGCDAAIVQSWQARPAGSNTRYMGFWLRKGKADDEQGAVREMSADRLKERVA